MGKKLQRFQLCLILMWLSGSKIKSAINLRRAEKPVLEGFSGCRLLPSSASGAPLALEEWSGQSPEEEKNHLIYSLMIVLQAGGCLQTKRHWSFAMNVP